MPVSEVALRVRGTSSIYSETDPLFIVDGVPVYAGPRDYNAGGIGGSWGSAFNPLSDINPMDIQSIDVLKDAAATAIYGARGAKWRNSDHNKNGCRKQTGSAGGLL